MELIIYNSENCPNNRFGDATIRVTKRGYFPLTTQALKLLGLKNGDRLEVANEKGTKNWFIRKTDKETDFLVYRISTSLGIRSVSLSDIMMRELKLVDSTSFLISNNPVKIDGVDYHQIITSRPIVVRKGKSKKQ